MRQGLVGPRGSWRGSAHWLNSDRRRRAITLYLLGYGGNRLGSWLWWAPLPDKLGWIVNTFNKRHYPDVHRSLLDRQKSKAKSAQSKHECQWPGKKERKRKLIGNKRQNCAS